MFSGLDVPFIFPSSDSTLWRPLPSTGSLREGSPASDGTIGRSDSLLSFSSGFVSFTLKYRYRCLFVCSLPWNRHCPGRASGKDHRLSHSGSPRRRQQGLPGSWRTLMPACRALRPRQNPGHGAVFSVNQDVAFR